MTNAILRGKPDAGNPHVRFDEGEVASAKPRRGSLLYKRMLRIMRQALCALLGLTQVGCSCFMPWCQDVVVSGSPGDAEVRIKGEGTRRAGGVFSLRRDRDYSGSVVREGYQEEYFHISSQVNAMGVLDIIGGCFWLLPFVGLGFPGSHSLERDHYIYDLKPLE